MAELGFVALILAFVTAVYGMVVSLYGQRTHRGELVRSAGNATYALFGLVSLATAALLYSFVTRDFSIEYVARVSSRDLPLPYTIAALWGGQEGSMLFWLFILTIYSSLAVKWNFRRDRPLMPGVLATLMGINLFFLTALIFAANPFNPLPVVPPDGQGLNPLLQNPGMMIHPVLLYLGYVGFAVPFAFAMAALATRRLDAEWLRSVRRWVLFPWFFQGIGILLGGQWAYVELGWGGYWAWDPVENASLMPFLVATAFLHSVMISERKEMLKIWNMLLVSLTFILSIFGTFLTRSGVIESVHAFAQSSIGYYFLIFLGVVIFLSAYFIVTRLDQLRAREEMESLLSRESAFLFNNLVFVGLALATFWGTIFPVLSEAVRGVKITVGPPFFNRVNVPIGLALILLTGIGPLIAWRRATRRNLSSQFFYPSMIALGLGGVLALGGARHPVALTSFMLCIFVLCTIVSEFWKGTRARRRITGESVLVALRSLVDRNKRRYGGYIVHVAMIVVFIAITGSSAYQQEQQVVMRVGDSVEFGGYTVVYDDFKRTSDPNRMTDYAYLTLYRNGKELGPLVPEKRYYRAQNLQPTTEVAIRSSPREDFYVILAAYDESGEATFQMYVNPLIFWLWTGGLIFVGGFVVSVLPDAREKERHRKQLEQELVAEREGA